MQVQRIQNNNINFGIKISPELIKEADNFYCKQNNSQEQFNRFYRKAKYMIEKYGFDDYTIFTKQNNRKGYISTALYAIKDGENQEPILLSVKDSMRKILEKFIHINEYELKNKLS